MHHSKKEIIAKQWNQMVSLDLQDQIEKEEAMENGQLSKEIGTIPHSALDYRK